MSVMMLAASKGTEIELIIDGPDEVEARDALTAVSYTHLTLPTNREV